MAKVTYIHEESLHNMSSPELIVPLIIKLFSPKNAVDFGCGIGTFLRAFQNHGVEDVTGLDGKWVDRQILTKYISENHFIETDLTQSVKLNRKFDVAISLEVGEHLPEVHAKTLVQSLTNASDVVVFGAAVPFQGGQNHLNEQWPQYWAALFHEFGYIQIDLIRPALWSVEGVQVWYKQNVFAYIRKGSQHAGLQPEPFPENFGAIHPEMYHYKAQKLELLQSGNAGISDYIKMAGKALLRKSGLRK